jgi:hypothetical protein
MRRAGLDVPRGVAVWMIVTVILAMLGVLAAVQPAQPPASDVLSPVRVLVGKWRASSEGQPGRATVEREYSGLFGSRFIQVRNQSTYAPQEKNPKGEVHEDMGVFSFDQARKQIVLRQFHLEGFVNQYVAEAPSKPKTVVFTTEAIENIPPGFRARETYTILGSDESRNASSLPSLARNSRCTRAALHTRAVIVMCLRSSCTHRRTMSWCDDARPARTRRA